MKKLLIFIMLGIVFISNHVNAQQYYGPNSIDMFWRVWDNESVFDWIIDNGQPINVYVNPTPRSSSMNLNIPTEVCLSYIKNNTFLCLSFSNAEGIRIVGDNVYRVNDYFETIKYMQMQYWFNIEYDRIVYSEALDWIVIPCGYNPDSGFNAITIGLSDSNSVRNIHEDIQTESEESKYYNLQGIIVDPSCAKGQILIKSNGRCSKKVMNR